MACHGRRRGQEVRGKTRIHLRETLGYISLDQARVLAMHHARENTDFYSEVYGQQELAWEVTD
jgi:hypothetical protein